MHCFLKSGVYVFRRILKLTVCEILWISAVFSIIIFVWSRTEIRNKNNVNSGIPTLVWWTTGFPSTSETITCEDNIKCEVISDGSIKEHNKADAYLFYASNIHFDNMPLPRNPNEILWGLYHEESPRNVQELLHEVTLSLFNYSATFSRHSDIPFPLQYLESWSDITSKKYFVPTVNKNEMLNEISPILYIQSDCETATERDDYVRELMKFIDVDSYGTCLKNKELPKQFTEDYLNNLNDIDFLKFIARYKFVLALENGICDDYVTEKFWRAIKVGSIPIYFGSPLIRDWFPNNKSAILLEDYPTPQKISEHIRKLMYNNNLYEEYLTHKTNDEINNKRLIDEFSTKPYQIDALKVATKFECLICQKVHEKKAMGKLKEKIVNKTHYNCPKPISALTLQVNPSNDWVYLWDRAKIEAEIVYKNVIGT